LQSTNNNINICDNNYLINSPGLLSTLGGVVIAGLVLSLREGLEAALVLGIVFGTLRKLDRPDLQRSVWLGTIGAIVISLLIGSMLTLIGVRLDGKLEQIFEGLAMLLAAGVLTWAIFWMRSQAARRSQVITTGVEAAILSGGHVGLTSLAFFAVVREGIELSLFLTASALSAGISNTLIGGLGGLLVAMILGWAAYVRLISLNLKTFFLLTGTVLVLFAAGLVAHGIHELNSAGWIPALIEPIWNIDPLLPESSFLGQIMKALLGYNSTPSLTEILGSLGYIAVLAIVLWKKPESRTRTDNRSV
jgi:high-affinity iron transporter